MTAPLVNSLNLQIKGVAPLVRIASTIVLALELDFKKRALGYAGVGSWQQFREESKSGERLDWDDYCETQTSFTADSVENFRQCAEAVKQRLKFSKKPEAKELLEAMENPPSLSTEAQRRTLIETIVSVGLTAGDTQSYLKKEYKAAQLPKPVADDDELYEKAIRLKPVVEEEAIRRHESMVRLALRALRRSQDLGIPLFSGKRKKSKKFKK